jgi:hypothetical protein
MGIGLSPWTVSPEFKERCAQAGLADTNIRYCGLEAWKCTLDKLVQNVDWGNLYMQHLPKDTMQEWYRTMLACDAATLTKDDHKMITFFKIAVDLDADLGFF